MKSKPWMTVVVTALAAMALSIGLQSLLVSEGPMLDDGRQASRIVSLSPGITETLFAIGAGERVVGRTDYCRHPEGVGDLPSGGTSLTPNLEAVVRMRADHIVAEHSHSVPVQSLAEIAPTTLIPWLTLDDVVAGVRALGDLTGSVEGAEKLAAKLENDLSGPVSEDGPRLLLLIGMSGAESTNFWFIRQNSLHGRVMGTVGVRNAIEQDINAAPTLGIEELIGVDPDAIIAVIPDMADFDGERQRYLDALGRMKMLRAVKTGKVGFLTGSDHLSTGPRILRFVDALRDELSRLGVLTEHT